MSALRQDVREHGFTLIELLVAIVVVGILTAVAIVGIGGLTDTAKGATCSATIDAARAGVASYYTKQSPNAYPVNFSDMTAPASPAQPDLVLQGGVVQSTNTLKDAASNTKWTISLGANGALTASGTAAGNCK